MTNELTQKANYATSNNDKLANDLKTVAGDANVLLKDLAENATEKLTNVRDELESKLDEHNTRMKAACGAMSDHAKALAESTHQYVRKNPWKTLGLAATAGILVGLLGRRL